MIRKVFIEKATPLKRGSKKKGVSSLSDELYERLVELQKTYEAGGWTKSISP